MPMFYVSLPGQIRPKCIMRVKAKARIGSQHQILTQLNDPVMFLQQMSRSQQMDELLDVLIESGGESLLISFYIVSLFTHPHVFPDL